MKFEVLVAVPTMIAIAVEMLPSSSSLKMEGAHPCHCILKTAFLTTLIISLISLFSSTYIFVSLLE